MDSAERSGEEEKAPGRGVLQGAFSLLEVLSGAPDGMGLSALSRECGLPKATTFRLVEQLVEARAVQRHERRYFIGELVARLGRSWRPYPRLRLGALEPVKTLATLTRTAVAVTVLDGDRIRVVTAALGSVDEVPLMQTDSDLAGRTAAGRVLLAAQPDAGPPAGVSAPEWRRFRSDLRRDGAVTVNHEDVGPGIRCAAAPVRLPDGTRIASISALVTNGTWPPSLPDLILRTADKITRNLAVR